MAPPVLAFTVEREAVTGHWPGPPGRMAGLVADGALTVTARTDETGMVVLPLPAHRLVQQAEIIDAATGQRLTKRPLEVRHAVQWLGWSCASGVISGSFRVTAPQGFAANSPLPVQAMDDGTVFMQTVAVAAEDGLFQFKGTPRRLLRPGETITVQPVAGGMAVDSPLTVTPEMIGAIGFVDAGSGEDVRGWLAPAGPNTDPVSVDIYLDGTQIGTVEPFFDRADVRALGLTDREAGFRLDLPPGLPRLHDTVVQVFLSDTEAELTNSPLILPPLPAVMGNFDQIDGTMLVGWAINRHAPDRPLTIEALCDGVVIASGAADMMREDVLRAGLATGRCGFRIPINQPLTALVGRDIALRDAATGLALDSSPRRVDDSSPLVQFLTRSERIPRPIAQRLGHRLNWRTRGTLLSIIMPVYNTRADWLIAALNSVTQQWAGGWELICVDDGSTAPHVAELLEKASNHDGRIRVIHAPGNMGIAGATNLGLQAARGDVVTFMDHDDVLEPDAVYRLALAASETGADLIYSDEAVVGEHVDHVLQVRGRPQFSHDYYLSHPYFVHMVAVRTALAREIGGYDQSLTISADVDFVLRVIERARKVAHVPSVLYRWRTHGSSTGHQKKTEVMQTTIGILNRHLERLGTGGKASEGLGYNQFRVDWPDDGKEVLIVIPTKNRVDLLKPCIDSIERTGKGANYRIVVIDHESDDRKTVAYLRTIAKRHTVMPYKGVFNYAKMNNAAVWAHGGDAAYIMFLNNDIEAIAPGWIQRLRSLAGRPDVGAVGPLLLYGDDRVQHGGVLMAFNGAADHAFKFQPGYEPDGGRNPGYNCSLTAVRDFSAVTAACLVMRHAVFRQLDGFDEAFVVGFNDTDLCLRTVAAGYKVLYDGQTVLYHHESATRKVSKSLDHPEDDTRLRTRWKTYFREGDPFYSPMLAPVGLDHSLRTDAGHRAVTKARTAVGPAQNKGRDSDAARAEASAEDTGEEKPQPKRARRKHAGMLKTARPAKPDIPGET